MRIALNPTEAGDTQTRLRIVHQRHTRQPLAQEQDEIKRWTAVVDFALDGKKATVIKDGDSIKDVQNVTIEGYLSTFKGMTAFDRQGDYVEAGAFKETLEKFRKNPVMLRDHTNDVSHLVGKFVSIEEDRNGLKFVGQLSNAPDVASVRIKVHEGILTTASMGGFFHYQADGHGIFKVDLFEGSLVPIPANPDARFSVRSLNETEKRFAKCMDRFTWHDFLRMEKA